MKKYLYKKVYKVPLYKGRLVIIFSNDTDKLSKIITDYDEEYIFAHCYYGNYKGYDGFITVFNFDDKITHSIILHEVIHCTNFILDKRGVISDFANDEFVTYLAEWICKKIYKFARKKKMKIK